jgi:hypothetical protein
VSRVDRSSRAGERPVGAVVQAASHPAGRGADGWSSRPVGTGSRRRELEQQTGGDERDWREAEGRSAIGRRRRGGARPAERSCGRDGFFSLLYSAARFHLRTLLAFFSRA